MKQVAAVQVRSMQSGDLERVLEIAQLRSEAPHWSAEAYQRAMDSAATPRRYARVAERAGELLGFAVVVAIAGEAELESIAVAPEAERQGVGRLILGHLLDLAQKENLSRILLEVRASNQRAIGFYRALGWQATGVRKRYYADPEEDAVLMEILVAAPAVQRLL